MYYIYDEEYLDDDGDFDYLMSPCYDSFEQAAGYGIIKAQRDNKKIVTLINDEGGIITFWNPRLDEPMTQGKKEGTVSFKKHPTNWVQKFKKMGELEGKFDPPVIPDICPEFDVD